MGELSTIGVDVAKSVFQIHGVDAEGTVVVRKRIGRAKVLEFFTDLPPCLVGMEACATAHQWARELKMLGHDTWLMPPSYAKAYVKRGTSLRIPFEVWLQFCSLFVRQVRRICCKRFEYFGCFDVPGVVGMLGCRPCSPLRRLV